MSKFESFIESPGGMWLLICVGMSIFMCTIGYLASNADPCQQKMDNYTRSYPSATPSQYLEFYKEVCDEKER